MNIHYAAPSEFSCCDRDNHGIIKMVLIIDLERKKSVNGDIRTRNEQEAPKRNYSRERLSRRLKVRHQDG